MPTDQIAGVLAVVLVFGGALYGFFKTKSDGFGKYTLSVLILTLVLFVASLAFALGKLELNPLANVLFAVAGYAGGLLTGKSEKADTNSP